MAKPPVSNRVQYDHIEHMALAQPAVRTLVVLAYSNREHGKPEPVVTVELHPVLAIRADIIQTYSRHRKPGDGDDPTPPRSLDHAGLTEDNWRREIRIAGYTPLVADKEYGVADLEDLTTSNSVTRVVACPWPAEEDDPRLADTIEELKKAAIEKEAGNR